MRSYKPVVIVGAIVNIDAGIGAHCVVNTGASVDHDSILSDGVQIGPGATLAGGVTVYGVSSRIVRQAG